MDFNSITISGRLFDMGFSPTKDENGGVAEGRLSVKVASFNNDDTFDEFNVRSFGKKSKFISSLKDGTSVMISGRIREDIRVNKSNPDTVRSKTYIEIYMLKVLEVPNDKS